MVELELEVDKPQANIAVRLCDVFPGGESARVTYGVLNLCHRESHEKPSPLKPGKRYRVRVQLDDVAYSFPKGHRIRLAISNSYWPLIWPSPEPVLMTLFSGAKSRAHAAGARQAQGEAAPVPAARKRAAAEAALHPRSQQLPHLRDGHRQRRVDPAHRR